MLKKYKNLPWEYTLGRKQNAAIDKVIKNR